MKKKGKPELRNEKKLIKFLKQIDNPKQHNLNIPRLRGK